MNKTIVIFILLLTFVSKTFSNEKLQKAEQAYDSKKYKDAILNYEELVKDGFKSYQLYYNLGNTYYKNNQLGKAIYYYELARKINPNDEDVRINLGIASAKTIDKIDAKENFFISAVKSNLLSSLSTSSWAWLSIATLLIGCVLFFVFVSSGNVALKRISFLFSIFLLIGFVITYSLGYSALKSKSENKFAIITAKEIKIMNEPTPAASSKFSLHEGTKIRVVENNGDWLLIKLDNGNEGWVKTTDVGII
ncbi:MAG: tetratricopeptide repeat protein [Bacteroidota bacterium]|nr:tetratricopeptide repeat protein [Bacteroidota bacterium]